MRKLLASIFLGLTLVFGGCGGQFAIHDPAKTEQATPAQKAQATLDQIKAVLVAVVEGAVADRKAGVYNDEEWFVLKGKLVEVKGHVDTAQGYLNIGDIGNAEGRMAIAQSLISVIKAELIKRSNP